MKIQSDMDLIIRLDKWLWAARFIKLVQLLVK